MGLFALTACTLSTEVSTEDRAESYLDDREAFPVDASSQEKANDGSDPEADADSSSWSVDASDRAGGGLGTIEGACGAIESLLALQTPSLLTNQIRFDEEDHFERTSLSSGGQRIFDTPNAGGSSKESEVMSFEILHACEGATLLKTETEISYSNLTPGPAAITDLLVDIGGKKVGVSVTRAYRPRNLPYSNEDITALLAKKLDNVRRSTERVATKDRWIKQILHVFAANEDMANAVADALPNIDAAVRADTIVLVTQTKGGGFVYCDPHPPLGSECP